MIKGVATSLMLVIFLPIILLGQTKIVRAFPNLTFANPVDIQYPTDNSNRLFIVSQNGIISVFENVDDISNFSVFLDISDRVTFGGEQGLLGLSFHPNYSSNGSFYLNYTTNSPRRTVISRFQVSFSNSELADINSELILLEINQPYSNHNGGQIVFGPDGYLYISTGDGGSGGDPQNNSQNLSSLLGKILRIDVDNSESGKNYAIPNSNPFKNNSDNISEEIFAFGLRNVWKFSFDHLDDLWAADVGQNKWEEINIIVSGGNYGWRIMEGLHCFNPSSNCDQTDLKLPIWEYDHSSSGGYSITGGYVYGGTNSPELRDKYIYADFVTGNIWSLDPIDTSNSLITTINGSISTFGIDNKKELYFSEYGSGKIYKFADDNANSVDPLISTDFRLHQNYPNPFNPTTKIEYNLPVAALSLPSRQTGSVGAQKQVSLKIYDILGKEVATLVNEKQKPGNYEIEFRGDDLVSGIYLYKLQVGNLVETKKMMMIK